MHCARVPERRAATRRSGLQLQTLPVQTGKMHACILQTAKEQRIVLVQLPSITRYMLTNTPPYFLIIVSIIRCVNLDEESFDFVGEIFVLFSGSLTPALQDETTLQPASRFDEMPSRETAADFWNRALLGGFHVLD